MTEGSPFERWLHLVLTLSKLGTPIRPAPSVGSTRCVALLEIFTLSCAVAASVLTLIAIGLAMAPVLGSAVAVGVDAGIAAAMGLSTFAWTRNLESKLHPRSFKVTPDLPPGQIAALLMESKGLSIAAGLLVGALAGGR